MFEKSNTIAKLSRLIRENKIEEFCITYQTAGFDIDSHRPWFTSSNIDLFKQAMAENKPAFVEMLRERIHIDRLACETLDIEHDGDTFQITMLYQAIANNMQDFALALIAHKDSDPNEGKSIRRTRYSAATRSSETYWAHIEDAFAITARVNNPAIVGVLFNQRIEAYEAHAKNLRENGFFFPKWRANSAEKKAAEFRAARDELLATAAKPAAKANDIKPPQGPTP